MNEFGTERSKPWNIYTSSDPSPSQTLLADKETPWKSLGTSMDAISFGFVATAILISMFLIMAIFEHLFRPNPSFSSPDQVPDGALGSRSVKKHSNTQRVKFLSHQAVKITLQFLVIFQITMHISMSLFSLHSWT
ncbi:hypothetical protein PTKIN_Ptkin02bG0246900 [Pterospermum kingtungense]